MRYINRTDTFAKKIHVVCYGVGAESSLQLLEGKNFTTNFLALMKAHNFLSQQTACMYPESTELFSMWKLLIRLPSQAQKKPGTP